MAEIPKAYLTKDITTIKFQNVTGAANMLVIISNEGLGHMTRQWSSLKTDTDFTNFGVQLSEENLISEGTTLLGTFSNNETIKELNAFVQNEKENIAATPFGQSSYAAVSSGNCIAYIHNLSGDKTEPFRIHGKHGGIDLHFDARKEVRIQAFINEDTVVDVVVCG